MKTYNDRKNELREEAREWLEWEAENPVSWEGLAIAGDYFRKQATRYGLIKEFTENGII